MADYIKHPLATIEVPFDFSSWLNSIEHPYTTFAPFVPSPLVLVEQRIENDVVTLKIAGGVDGGPPYTITVGATPASGAGLFITRTLAVGSALVSLGPPSNPGPFLMNSSGELLVSPQGELFYAG